MKRIHIYEWEPGDFRFDDDIDDDPWVSYVEVSEMDLQILQHLNESRAFLNKCLKELKEREIDPCD